MAIDFYSQCNEIQSLSPWYEWEYGDSVYRKCLNLCAVISIMCFVVSSITGNVSQTDKLWSITPVVYAWICVVDKRTLLMAILVSIWGARLTYNFNRRGGYKFPKFWEGDEDYRWEVLRSGRLPCFRYLTNPVVWTAFNLCFISFYQQMLLLAIVSPSLVAYTAFKLSVSCKELDTSDLGIVDFLASALIISFIILEGVADNQQFQFQKNKRRSLENNEKLKDEYSSGFCQNGLFAIMRKPNYASEQMIWVSYYLFSIASFPFGYLNWSICGCILLILLFRGSGWMTELVSVAKYPKYAEYQQNVPLYIPKVLWSGVK